MKSNQILEIFREKQAKREVQEIDISLPGLPELDDQINVMEVSGKDIKWAKDNSIGPNGESDEQVGNAGLIVRSLISREEYKEGFFKRIFPDEYVDFVAGFGSKTLMILNNRVNDVSGLTQEFIESTKKKSKTTPNTNSDTSSQKPLE